MSAVETTVSLLGGEPRKRVRLARRRGQAHRGGWEGPVGPSPPTDVTRDAVSGEVDRRDTGRAAPTGQTV